MNNNQVVMVFGTFDLLHPGHVDFFRQARTLGKRVVAVVARDQTVEKVKGRLPVHNEDMRLENLRALRVADEVMLGGLGDKFQVIRDIKPDIIALGYDQNSIVENLEEKVGSGVRVMRLKPFKPEIYKSSKLRKDR